MIYFGQMRAGIQGGLNVSNLYVDDVSDENARFGVNLGFYGRYCHPKFLRLTKVRNRMRKFFDHTVKYDLGYLDLPV